MSEKVDISEAVNMLDSVKIDGKKATIQLEAVLALKGEKYMKSQSPVRTGTLRRSMHASPSMKPWGVATSVTYAHAANVRSRRPHFIENTVSYIGSIAKNESQKILNREIS